MREAFERLGDWATKAPWFSTDRSKRTPVKVHLAACALKVENAVIEYPKIAGTLQKCFDKGGQPFDIAYFLFMVSERSSADVVSMLKRAGLSRKALQAMAKRVRTAADDIENFNSPRLPGIWSHATEIGMDEMAEEFYDLPSALRFYADAVAGWPPEDWRAFGARSGQNFEAVYLHLYLKAFGDIVWDDFEDLLAFADHLRGQDSQTKGEAARKRINLFADNHVGLYKAMQKDTQEYVRRNVELQRQGTKRTKYFPHVLADMMSKA